MTAADEFLALLSDDQRAATVFEFADLDAKRTSWSNFEPGIFDDRQGARFGDLDEDQKAAAMAVLASVLSAGGYEYVEGAMAAEDQLIPGNIDEYYLAFYGEPSTDEPWTLQFGGHHLAIHISMGGGILSVSPYFQGVQPIVLDVDGATIEPMANDTNNMFGLFESLDDDQLAAANLTRAVTDLVMGPQVDTGYPEPEGLPYTELTAEQQDLVRAVDLRLGGRRRPRPCRAAAGRLRGRARRDGDRPGRSPSSVIRRPTCGSTDRGSGSSSSTGTTRAKPGSTPTPCTATS